MVMNTIKKCSRIFYIITYETKTIHDGFWVKTIKKGKLLNEEKDCVV